MPSALSTTIAVATVHLESLSNAPMRAAQLERIHAHLARHETAVLAGDFNISATGPYGKPEEHLASQTTLLPGFADLWLKEHGSAGDDESAAGFGAAVTFDTTINTMNRLLGHGAECSRYDRVMVRGGNSKPGSSAGSAISIIGNQPILPRPKELTNDIFISDHFGLAFTLSTSTTSE